MKTKPFIHWLSVRDHLPPPYLPILVKDVRGDNWVAYRGDPLNNRTRFFIPHWDLELPETIIEWISFEALGDSHD